MRRGVVISAAAWAVALALPTVSPAADAPRLPFAAGSLHSLRVAGSGSGPFAPTSHPSLEGSAVEELIVTRAALAPAFQRLAAWKTAKGVPTVVRTIEDIEASGVHGSDVSETVRLYIRAAYLDWGVRFVLLGGDTDIIPPRYATAEFLGLSNPPTDLYYACLDGDWNAN